MSTRSQLPLADTVHRPGRIDLMDAAKGIAILLMVYGHTEQGARHRHMWDAMPRWNNAVTFSDAFIYSFHMPTFFVVAGLFLAGSAQKRGSGPFVLEKLKTILYPYLLWGLIQGLSNPLTAPFRGDSSRLNLGDLLASLAGGNESWFLPTLFICQILALATLKLPNWGRMLVALAFCYSVPASGVVIFYRPFLYFPFVAAGMWVGSEGIRRLAALPRTRLMPWFAVLAILQLTMIAAWGAANRWDEVPIGLVGIAMLLLFCGIIKHTALERVLCRCGEASLGIFVLSPFCQGGAREMVTRLLHTTAPAPQLLLPVACASLIPGLLWHRQAKLHLTWMFLWPGRSAPAS